MCSRVVSWSGGWAMADWRTVACTQGHLVTRCHRATSASGVRVAGTLPVGETAADQHEDRRTCKLLRQPGGTRSEGQIGRWQLTRNYARTRPRKGTVNVWLAHKLFAKWKYKPRRGWNSNWTISGLLIARIHPLKCTIVRIVKILQVTVLAKCLQFQSTIFKQVFLCTCGQNWSFSGEKRKLYRLKQAVHNCNQPW